MAYGTLKELGYIPWNIPDYWPDEAPEGVYQAANPVVAKVEVLAPFWSNLWPWALLGLAIVLLSQSDTRARRSK